MSNIPFLRHASAFALLLGIALVLGTSSTILQAKLTGYGSTVLDHPETPATIAPFHSAAKAEESLVMQAMGQLLLGMMLILLGFLLYSLALLKSRGERRVRVHAARHHIAVPGRVQRHRSAYYMEIRI